MIDDFQSAMYEAGIIYKGHIISDGKIHRFFSTGGKKSNKDGWYVSHGRGACVLKALVRLV